MYSLKLKSYTKINSINNKSFLLIIGLMTLLAASPVDHPQLENLPPDSDVIEIVDYQKEIIVGYLVLQNGRIIKKISLSIPLSINTSPTNEEVESYIQDQQESLTLPQYYKDEEELIDTPKTKKFKTKKFKKLRYKKDFNSINDDFNEQQEGFFIDSDSIEQQQGEEIQVINKIYQDREWDKRKIPHEVTTKVLDIEALRYREKRADE